MKRIAFPKNPDADALVAAWLAVNYLFDGESCVAVFVVALTFDLHSAPLATRLARLPPSIRPCAAYVRGY